ncbi:MAG: M3 family metallopeptidase, partial [bacterium]
DDDEALRKTGRRFRDTVLGLGGSRPPMEIFAAFRGRPPTTAALLRHAGLR